MATVPRLNKTIIPTLTDPSAIGRAGQLGAVITQGAEIGLRFKQAKDATFASEKAVQYERDVDTFFEDFKLEASDDPDGRRVDFDKFKNERFRELSEGGSGAAIAELSKIRDNVDFKYGKKYDNFAQVQNVSNFNQSFDNTVRDSSVLAFRAGQRGEELGDIPNNIDMAQVAGSTFMSQGDLVVLGDKANGVVAQEYLQGLTEFNPSAAKRRIDSGEFDELLTSDQLQALGKSAELGVKTDVNKQKSSIKKEIRFVQNLYKNGIEFPKEDLNELKINAQNAGLENEVNALTIMENTFDSVNAFVHDTTLTGQSEKLEQLRSDLATAPTEEKLIEFKALNTVFANKIAALKTDPLAYYESIKAIEKISPLDTTSAEAMAEEVENRRASQLIVSARDGINIPLITKGEAQDLKQIYDTGQPMQIAAALSAYQESFSPEELRQLTQIVAGQGAEMMAVALTLPQDDAQTLIEGDKATGEVAKAKIRTVVNEQIGGTIFDVEALEGVHSAVYAVYKKMSIDSGDSSKEPDDNRVRDAIETVVGKPVNISPNNSRVFTYKDENGKFVSENKLEDILHGITDQNLVAVTGGTPIAADGLPVSVKEILLAGKFISAGDGQYLIRIDSLGDLIHRDGRPYVIDARKLEPKIRVPIFGVEAAFSFLQSLGGSK